MIKMEHIYTEAIRKKNARECKCFNERQYSFQERKRKIV